MSDGLNVERFIALIHSAPPQVLAQLLQQILQSPEMHLEHLKIFVLELGVVVARLLLLGDRETATRLRDALGAALSEHVVDVEDVDFIGASLPARDALILAYYLGRLQTLQVICHRLLIFDVPPHIRAEIDDAGPNRLLLQILAERGALTLRALHAAQRERLPVEASVSMPELRQVVGLLVRADLVTVESRGNRGVLYRLSELGRRLTERLPSWLEAVERAYESYRRDGAVAASPFSRVLREIFGRIDAAVTDHTPGETGPHQACPHMSGHARPNRS